jgi:hypothetical protein
VRDVAISATWYAKKRRGAGKVFGPALVRAVNETAQLPFTRIDGNY